MIICPYCGAENIEGVDSCDQCEQSLSHLSLPTPASAVEADLLRDRIELLAPATPISVAPGTPVGEVLNKMVDGGVGCVMVVDGDQLVGIFSERDALLKLNVDSARMSERPVSDFMTADPVTLAVGDKIAFALHKMNLGGYRHIPIFAEGKLVGVISIRDILTYLTERIGATQP